MKNSLRLNQRQGQKLTPQLQLAIRLLQFSRAELEHEIDAALAGNPLLERVEHERGESPPAGDADEPDAARLPEPDTAPDETRGPGEAHTQNWEWLPEPDSLRRHLLSQLQLGALGARDLAIGEALIDALDDDGYCPAGFDDIRAASGLRPPARDAEIEAVRHLIQRFDPLAVASRGLSECLLVQLEEIAAEPDVLALARTIAAHQLDLLAKSGTAAVAKACGRDLPATADAVCLLKTLDPKPGSAFQHSRTDYIEPDFAVFRSRGRWQAQALADTRSPLRINAFYRNLMLKSRPQDAAYLEQYHREAQWLIKSLASRRETLQRVVDAVLRKQQPFLELGPSALQAMTLREIGDGLGLHESTVSRACSGKYLATPHGLFELAGLFRSGIADDSGLVQSAAAVQARIAALIGAEDARKPLSDAALEKHLAQQGLPIARRTVAKYREALRLPPSHERRKPA